MTVNKAQGQTLDRMIVAISHRPGNINFSYEAINVALTRVRDSKNMRLFLTGENETKRQHSLEYLLSLFPDETVDIFFKSFRPSEKPWYEQSFHPNACTTNVAQTIRNLIP